jgi:hypothetical protein
MINILIVEHDCLVSFSCKASTIATMGLAIKPNAITIALNAINSFYLFNVIKKIMNFFSALIF